MKKVNISVLSLLLLILTCYAQIPDSFDRYFVDKTMRIDYFHIGDAKEEIGTIDQVYEQRSWAGSLNNLIDAFDNGRYSIKVYDLSSDTLIFSKGFDSYFGEYKTTDSAIKGVKRTYHETALIPYPKNKIRFVLEVRNRKNTLVPFFSQVIDPASVDIRKEPLDEDVKVFDIVKNGHPHRKVDVAIIAEGYTSNEEEKVRADLLFGTESLNRLDKAGYFLQPLFVDL
jgi:hypothetical protein